MSRDLKQRPNKLLRVPSILAHLKKAKAEFQIFKINIIRLMQTDDEQLTQMEESVSVAISAHHCGR